MGTKLYILPLLFGCIVSFAHAQEAAAPANDTKSFFSTNVSVKSVVGDVKVNRAEKKEEFTVPDIKSKDTFAIKAVNKKLREIKAQTRPTQNLGDPLSQRKNSDGTVTKADIAKRILGIKETGEVADALSTIQATSDAVRQSTQGIDGSLQSPDAMNKAINAVDKAVDGVSERERQKSRLKLQEDYTF